MENLKSFAARRFPLPSRYIGEKSLYKAGGESATVYWVPEDRMNTPGKTTIFNNIRLSEELRRDFPGDVVDYVFLHELGHANRGGWKRVLYVVATIGSFVATPVLALFTLILTGLIIPDISLLRIGAVAAFLVLTILVGLFHCRVQWGEELKAELFALEKLGEAEFCRRRTEWEESVDRGFFSKLQKRLYYPEEGEILSAYAG